MKTLCDSKIGCTQYIYLWDGSKKYIYFFLIFAFHSPFNKLHVYQGYQSLSIIV